MSRGASMGPRGSRASPASSARAGVAVHNASQFSHTACAHCMRALHAHNSGPVGRGQLHSDDGGGGQCRLCSGAGRLLLRVVRARCTLLRRVLEMMQRALCDDGVRERHPRVVICLHTTDAEGGEEEEERRGD